jgi:hypothetical protein
MHLNYQWQQVYQDVILDLICSQNNMVSKNMQMHYSGSVSSLFLKAIIHCRRSMKCLAFVQLWQLVLLRMHRLFWGKMKVSTTQMKIGICCRICNNKITFYKQISVLLAMAEFRRPHILTINFVLWLNPTENRQLIYVQLHLTLIRNGSH